MDMPSGAGHDAMHIAQLCPAGMIFVPCERGISHNEIENATPADLAAGTRVLVEVLEELANRCPTPLSPRAKRGAFEATGKVPRYARDDRYSRNLRMPKN